MSLFTSPREKRLWMLVLLITGTIFSTLFIGRPLQQLLSNQDVQAVFFLLGLLLVSATVLLNGLKAPISKTEITIWVGLLAVYLMLFLRLGLTERSHLIEYSVLAIFVHLALIERLANNRTGLWIALVAFIISTGIGVVDELAQIFLPNRVFDSEDIVFNTSAVLMAIGSSLLLQRLRQRARQRRNENDR